MTFRSTEPSTAARPEPARTASSSTVASAASSSCTARVGCVEWIETTRPVFGPNGASTKRMLLARLNTTVFAPSPSASVTVMIAASAGRLRIDRTAAPNAPVMPCS